MKSKYAIRIKNTAYPQKMFSVKIQKCFGTKTQSTNFYFC